MFGINGGELVVLAILAFLLIGPERLPELAQQLARVTREVKKIAVGAREKVKEELGPEFEDLAALDPRQYDPRRIVREALMEDEERPASKPRAARRTPQRSTTRPASAGSPTPETDTAASAATVAAGAATAGAAAAAAKESTAQADQSETTASPTDADTAAVSDTASPSHVPAAATDQPGGSDISGTAAATTGAGTAVALDDAPDPDAATTATPADGDGHYVVPFDDEAT